MYYEPIGFVVRRWVPGAADIPCRFLVRGWRERENHWTLFLGEAQVFKRWRTANSLAFRVEVPGSVNEVVPVYRDPAQYGLNALNPFWEKNI